MTSQLSAVLSPPDGVSGMTPDSYALDQNYPNSFNPSTEITYFIPKSGPVTVRILDLLGREVATLVAEREEAGPHSVHWNAQGYPSGI